ncbi:hypothetical protein [Campylobacter sp. MG1]|uniref:hypothetical protein n=1 Tax=Campylobacter sp. MG1 TaxID=2976332 RepID=UPI00226D2644|nr:hypothetical protein [Campylobacter sp. MG1]
MTQKEFNDRLKKNGLNLDDFSKLIDTPVGTIYNWNRKDKTPPNWVVSWFDNYEKAKSYEYIKNKVFEIEKIK